MKEKQEYFPANAFRICIDHIDGDISGRIYSPLVAESISFVSMSEVLVKMDELFDRFGYPQAFQDKRSFDSGGEKRNLYKGRPKSVQETEVILKQSGEKSTFDILVESRQNTSWQGTLCGACGNVIAQFDGEVELLSMLERVTGAAE